MRLIDADTTIGLLKTRLYETALNNAGVNCDASYLYTECADNRIETWIDEIPTVDVDSLNAKHEDIGYEKGYRDGYAEALDVADNTEPIRHGHWENPMALAGTCSMCGYTILGIIDDFKYCPVCGAKMDGERKEDE